VKSKVIGKGGPPCPRCGKATQVRTHLSIGRKQLRQPYFYSRWFKCTNKKCRTTLIMPPEYIVWNSPTEGSIPLGGLLGQLSAEELSRNAGRSNGAPFDGVAPTVKRKRDCMRIHTKAEPDDGRAATKAVPWDKSANGGDR
jgi:hypothetical protein